MPSRRCCSLALLGIPEIRQLIAGCQRGFWAQITASELWQHYQHRCDKSHLYCCWQIHTHCRIWAFNAFNEGKRRKGGRGGGRKGAADAHLLLGHLSLSWYLLLGRLPHYLQPQFKLGCLPRFASAPTTYPQCSSNLQFHALTVSLKPKNQRFKDLEGAFKGRRVQKKERRKKNHTPRARFKGCYVSFCREIPSSGRGSNHPSSIQRWQHGVRRERWVRHVRVFTGF